MMPRPPSQIEVDHPHINRLVHELEESGPPLRVGDAAAQVQKAPNEATAEGLLHIASAAHRKKVDLFGLSRKEGLHRLEEYMGRVGEQYIEARIDQCGRRHVSLGERALYVPL